MTSMTWNSVSLPLPERDGIEIEVVPVVAARRMLSGTLRVDVTALKARARVRWRGLTSAQRSTLRARYDAADAATLTLPDGQSFTAAAVAGSWRESHFYDSGDACWYDVQIEFQEI